MGECFVLDVFHLIQDTLHRIGQFMSEFGDKKLSPNNFDQGDIELTLKVLKLDGDGRLGQMKGLSSLGDALEFNDFQEDTELVEGIVHKLVL